MLIWDYPGYFNLNVPVSFLNLFSGCTIFFVLITYLLSLDWSTNNGPCFIINLACSGKILATYILCARRSNHRVNLGLHCLLNRFFYQQFQCLMLNVQTYFLSARIEFEYIPTPHTTAYNSISPIEYVFLLVETSTSVCCRF